MEKMPSASNSPIVGRKNSSEDVNSKKGQPLSVASMVRRFERDTGLGDAKNRGGELERSNSSLNKSDSQKLIIDRSSRNSSLNSSQADIPAAVNIEAVASTEAVETEDKPIQSPKASTITATAPTTEQSSLEKTVAEPSAKPSKTVRNFDIFKSAHFLL